MSRTEQIERVKQMLKSFFDVRGMTVNANSLRLWLDAFSDLSVESIEMAIRRYNRECTDFPTPAGVRKYAGPAALTDEQRAVAAWRSVRSSVRRYGAYYAVEFDDPIIHAAIRAIGGWVNLCNTQHDEMQWKAKSFLSEYVSIARSGIGEFQKLGGLLSNQPVAVETGLLPHIGLKRLGSQQPAPQTAGHLTMEPAL